MWPLFSARSASIGTHVHYVCNDTQSPGVYLVVIPRSAGAVHLGSCRCRDSDESVKCNRYAYMHTPLYAKVPQAATSFLPWGRIFARPKSPIFTSPVDEDADRSRFSGFKSR